MELNLIWCSVVASRRKPRSSPTTSPSWSSIQWAVTPSCVTCSWHSSYAQSSTCIRRIMPPPSIVTPALLSSIRRQQHLPRGCWYFVTGVALNALNLSAEIPTVFKHAIENGTGSSDVKPSHDEKLEIARKMREALVKAAAICGLPKVCSAHLCIDLG